MLEFFVFFVLAFLGLFVNFEEAVELENRAGNAEPECVRTRFSIDVDGRLIEDRRHDLRRHKALPDQLVNFEFIFL